MYTLRNILPVLLSATLLLSLAACELIGLADSDDDSSDDSLELVGPTWQLVSFEDSTGTLSDNGSTSITLTFTDEGKVQGQSFTSATRYNNYWGTYETSADSNLTVGGARGLLTTEVGEPAGSKYITFLGALSDASAYEVGDNMLRIAYDDGRALNFEIVEEE